MKTKQGKRDLSKKHIINSALKVIGQEGVKAVTHRSVAKEAVVAHSTVSYYFRTVEDILTNSFTTLMNDLDLRATEIGLEIIENKGKLTAQELVQIGADQSRAHLESGYLLRARYELHLYAISNKKFKSLYINHMNSAILGMENILKKIGYKKADGRMLFYLLLGHEMSALVDDSISFSNLGEEAIKILNQYK